MPSPTETSRHLALYVPSLRGGGAERVMVNLANGLAARGHRVDLVLTKAEGPFLDEVAEGVRLVDLNKGRVLASLLPLVGYLRRERPDAMLSALNHANIVAILACKAARAETRLVVSEHSAPSGALRGGASRNASRVLMRWLYPRADAIVGVSRGLRDELRDDLGLPDSKLHTIYNPIDLERIRTLKKTPIHHPWISEHHVPVILAVGRLTAAKDYPTLLHAFARLRAHREARLVILGQGEDEAGLKALVQDLRIAADVHFAGFQANPYGWMSVCDLYVLSSKWEGFSCTLLEALACGAKVVSTDCRSGPSEILEGGKWGRLVPVGDVNALARAIELALSENCRTPVSGRSTAFRADIAVAAYDQLLATEPN